VRYITKRFIGDYDRDKGKCSLIDQVIRLEQMYSKSNKGATHAWSEMLNM